MLPRRYLPSIPSLLALEALDRLGTASAAAAELSLTQGAISKQLQVLEGQLGVSLLIREGKRLILTPAARDFVVQARNALKTLTDASLTLRANPGGRGAEPGYPARLRDALAGARVSPALSRAHPEVTINLSTRLRPFDFAATAFDAAIHYGRQDWPGVSYLKLMDEEIMAVAAPRLLPKPLPSAAAVLDHPLMQLESRTGDWSRWLARHGHLGLRPPAMLFDQFATMAQAAVHGLGLALLPAFLIGDDLASGRLIPAFGPPVRALGSYYLVWPQHAPGTRAAGLVPRLADGSGTGPWSQERIARLTRTPSRRSIGGP